MYSSGAVRLRGEERRELAGRVPDTVRLVLDREQTPPVWVPTLITSTHLARSVGGFDPNLRFGIFLPPFCPQNPILFWYSFWGAVHRFLLCKQAAHHS